MANLLSSLTEEKPNLDKLAKEIAAGIDTKANIPISTIVNKFYRTLSNYQNKYKLTDDEKEDLKEKVCLMIKDENSYLARSLQKTPKIK